MSNGYSPESARPLTPHTKLKDVTSRNDIIVIESHSINHISTLTVFKGHQGNNQSHKPQKKKRSSDGQKFTANVKSECFLSNRRWREVVPVHRQKAFLIPLENQQSDQESNQNVENISNVHEGQNGVEEHNPETSDQPQDTQSNQPITSDQSKPDQCIYEEIQMISPASQDPNTHQNNHTQPSDDDNAAAEDHGEYSTINTEERTCQEGSKSETGSDVTCKPGKGQKVYSSVMKSSVVNHHVQDCRPRITVVSTSL